MKVDTALRNFRYEELSDAAVELERLGHDGIWMSEINHDPFLPLAEIGHKTSTVSLGTAIAVAFARNPMQMAYIANDLQIASKGRFILGLGSQVRAHVTRRFSMPWSHPAARMREFVSAIHAIWDCFDTGEQLDFQGDFYTHTLMTKEFSPGLSLYPKAPIFLAAVGERMTEVAAGVADGIFLHSFMTERYLNEVTLPTIEQSLASAGRGRSDFSIVCSQFIVTGSTEESFVANKEAIRRRVAWYGSTPAYLPVLALHGWQDIGDELHRISVSKEPNYLEQMDKVVDDEVLSAFAVIAEPQDLASKLRARVEGKFDRLRLNNLSLEPDQRSALIHDLKG